MLGWMVVRKEGSHQNAEKRQEIDGGRGTQLSVPPWDAQPSSEIVMHFIIGSHVVVTRYTALMIPFIIHCSVDTETRLDGRTSAQGEAQKIPGAS